MKAIVRGIKNWLQEGGAGWNHFWFTPMAPHSLCVIRILTGCMLLYSHAVWALDLDGFLGPHSWVTSSVAREAAADSFVWSHLWFIESTPLLWIVHVGAMIVFALLMLGLCTRVVSIASWLLAVAYCHRLSGTLFGLDQVTSMLAMYLMIGPSGAAYSLDAWLAKRRNPLAIVAAPSTSATVAVRLLQLHMCIIYLFSGLGKLQGESWWNGEAVWFSSANLEYQYMIDMTWLAHHLWLLALLAGWFAGVRAHVGTLVLSSAKGGKRAELLAGLDKIARGGGVTTYIVRLLDDGSIPGDMDDMSALFSFGGGNHGPPPIRPLIVYRLSHGKETLVRGVTLENLLPRSFKEVSATGNEPVVYNYSDGGPGFSGVPSTIIAPALLFPDVDIRRQAGKHRKPPVYPSPLVQSPAGSQSPEPPR
jgi:uncharacterized membrane protein YphA (DoxX/SURF4 family)